MKFCMITTFFGAHSFGGDAAYVDRLSQALCRRGHEVHVYYCVDAFNAVRDGHPLRSYSLRRGCTSIRSRARSAFSRRWRRQATGMPLFKSRRAQEVLDDPGDGRRAFPQHLAGRRAGAPGSGGQPAGRPDHDGSRALADLPDAPALEIRPKAVRRAELRELLPEGATAAPGSGG